MFNVACTQHPVRDPPGKRAPTVKMCESDENYVPLNDGLNWKGDRTDVVGAGLPQLPPGRHSNRCAAAPSPIAAVDTTQPRFILDDGTSTRIQPGRGAGAPQTWQSMCYLRGG